MGADLHYSQQDLLIQKDAAAYLGVSRRTIARYVTSKRIKVHTLGGKDRYKVADLDRIRAESGEAIAETATPHGGHARLTSPLAEKRRDEVDTSLDEMLKEDMQYLEKFAFDKDAPQAQNQENLRSQMLYLIDKYNLLPRYVALAMKDNFTGQRQTLKDLLERAMPRQSQNKNENTYTAMDQLVDGLVKITSKIVDRQVVIEGEVVQDEDVDLPVLEISDLREDT